MSWPAGVRATQVKPREYLRTKYRYAFGTGAFLNWVARSHAVATNSRAMTIGMRLKPP